MLVFIKKTIVLKVNYRYNDHDFSKLQPCLYWWCNINSTTLIVRFTREEKTDVTRVTPLPPMFKNIIIVNVKDHTNSTSRDNSKRYLSETMVKLRKSKLPCAISMQWMKYEELNLPVSRLKFYLSICFVLIGWDLSRINAP